MKLDRIAHEDGALQARAVQAAANCTDAAVHHVARRHAIGTGLRVAEGRLLELGDAGVIVEVVALRGSTPQ